MGLPSPPGEGLEVGLPSPSGEGLEVGLPSPSGEGLGLGESRSETLASPSNHALHSAPLVLSLSEAKLTLRVNDRLPVAAAALRQEEERSFDKPRTSGCDMTAMPTSKPAPNALPKNKRSHTPHRTIGWMETDPPRPAASA